MRLYKVVWAMYRDGIEWNWVDYFEATSCQTAREYLLTKLPNATKIAVRPHYGELPW